MIQCCIWSLGASKGCAGMFPLEYGDFLKGAMTDSLRLYLGEGYEDQLDWPW
jgi:hypothetical protein